MKWTDALGSILGLLKYVFVAGLALFMVYMVGLLRRHVD
jgi:hypothetical protein